MTRPQHSFPGTEAFQAPFPRLSTRLQKAAAATGKPVDPEVPPSTQRKSFDWRCSGLLIKTRNGPGEFRSASGQRRKTKLEDGGRAGAMEEPGRRRRRKRSPRRSRSPPSPSEDASRSASKKKSKSSNKKRKRSRSPRQVIGKIKQERPDHSRRGHEERQHRDHSELEHRAGKSGERGRRRDHSSRRKPRRERPGSHEREADHHLQEQQAQREFYNERRREHRQLLEASGDEENRSAGRPGSKATEKEPGNKEKPSFELSGALLEDTNTFRGVVIKYTEPPEARIPKKRWRLYPFKNDEVLPVMYIHRQSAYLLGRHRRIADIPIDHPSCSKQHAVFQYR